MHYPYTIVFSPDVISRAYAYANEQSITELRHDPEQSIYAKVLGSSSYEVNIQLKGCEIMEIKCSCPVSQNCKHSAAVFLFLEEKYLKEKKIIH